MVSYRSVVSIFLAGVAYHPISNTQKNRTAVNSDNFA
jgi:hypothetical protein